MRAKKRYGQHFLKNPQVCQRIASECQTRYSDNNILEVGPGKGALTQHLLKLANKNLLAVEADRDMYAYMEKHYSEEQLSLLQADFLDVDLSTIFEGESFCLIGNFPYNISSQILFKMLEHKDRIPLMIGMFQKEVGDRIVSSHGRKSYGILSVLTQAFYTGEYLFTVDKSEFEPPPKVQSAVISLQRKSNLDLPCSEKTLRAVVKASFQQRRKMLRNSLKPLHFDISVLSESDLRKRPEQLSVDDYIQIAHQLEQSI